MAPSHSTPAAQGLAAARTSSWLAGALLAMVVAGWWSGREQRGLLSLPAPIRREIYLRTLSSVTALCTDQRAADAVASRCQDSARFLVEFPECDEACRTLARPFLPEPTR
ncbi:MAG TPA: hypothetical protein VGK20_13555 [Candidatus Binatia bacterium]